MSRASSAMTVLLASTTFAATAQTAADPRLREISYDAHAVVTLPVRRGVVTLIVLDPDEAIVELASGLGADCSKPDAAWCVAAQPGGRTIFIKPKSTADEANNLSVVTDRRTHAFRLIVLADGDAVQPVYRLMVKSPSMARSSARRAEPGAGAIAAPDPELPDSQQAIDVRARLRAMPEVVNSSYSLAEGAGSADIVPSLVFDDGRFTYLRFAANREVPAVFHVLGDGAETLVNTRMEGDLLVVDRVSRQLVLRSGRAVVGIWNDAFDGDGRPPALGTTVSGVARVIRSTTDRTKGQP